MTGEWLLISTMQVTQAKLDSWVRCYGTNSNSYVLLEGPKSYFTTPAVDGFLAYQVSAGVALIAGDPVCAPHQARRLIHDFTSVMRRPVRGTMELLTTEILRLLHDEGYHMASMGNDGER